MLSAQNRSRTSFIVAAIAAGAYGLHILVELLLFVLSEDIQEKAKARNIGIFKILSFSIGPYGIYSLGPLVLSSIFFIVFRPVVEEIWGRRWECVFGTNFPTWQGCLKRTVRTRPSFAPYVWTRALGGTVSKCPP